MVSSMLIRLKLLLTLQYKNYLDGANQQILVNDFAYFFFGITPFLGNFVFVKSTTGFLSVFPEFFITKPLCPYSLPIKGWNPIFKCTQVQLLYSIIYYIKLAILIVWLHDFLYCQDECYAKLYGTSSLKCMEKVTKAKQ